ncbi:MAG: 4Fe-4S binding protein [Dehalococcoidales bacterium]|jgi:polyferredoxin
MEDTKRINFSVTMTNRQRIRRAIILISFLLFPITFKFFSPYIIMDGASQGIIDGSFFYFIFLFVFSLFFGRAVCGWFCPAAGVQEWSCTVNNKRVRGGKFNWIKYFIWVPWVGAIVAATVATGGFNTINPFYLIDNGVSLSSVPDFFIFYIVIAIIVGFSLTVGRRAFCHYLCWMAPFMVIGTKISQALKLPSLHLISDKSKCVNCLTCTSNCPMSLEVNGMVQKGNMRNSECILCGTCVDNCPNKTIQFSWRR